MVIGTKARNSNPEIRNKSEIPNPKPIGRASQTGRSFTLPQNGRKDNIDFVLWASNLFRILGFGFRISALQTLKPTNFAEDPNLLALILIFPLLLL